MPSDMTLELVDRFAGHSATWREAAEDVDEAIAHGYLSDNNYSDAARAIRQANPPESADLLDDECKACLVALAAAVHRLGVTESKTAQRETAAFLARALKGV